MNAASPTQHAPSPAAPAAGRRPPAPSPPSPEAPASGDRKRVRGSQKARTGYLFISGSTYRRIPVFRYAKPRKVFLHSLEAYRSEYGLRIHAFALMPDHYHLLLWFPPERRPVDFLRDFKSLVGKRIIEWLRVEKLDRLLARFRLKREPRRDKDARYCILQYNSHVKVLDSSRALRQKIGYIHLNPVKEGLAASPEAYTYSSARNYAGYGLSIVKIERLELPYD